MERGDLPMITPADEKKPTRVHLVRKGPAPEPAVQGRESAPTERIDTARVKPSSAAAADIHAVAPAALEADEVDGLHLEIERALKALPRVIKDRDEARTRAAGLEHELIQARERLTSLQLAEDHSSELQTQIDSLKQAQEKLAVENATLKTRVAEVENLLRKREVALENAKDASQAAEKKLEYIKNLLG